MHFIHMKIFILQVCIQHFSDELIIKESSFIDSATGNIIKVPLSHYKLKDGAVPSIFDGCPSYMTKNIKCRETRDEKLKNAEMRNMNIAITESLKSNEEYKKNHFFSDYGEFRNLLKGMNIDSFWFLHELSDKTCFTAIDFVPCPIVKFSIVIYHNLNVEVFAKNVKLRNIGKFNFPFSLSSVNELEELLHEVKSYHVDKNDCNEIVDLIHELLNQLKEHVSNEKINAIEFLDEQISLLLVQKNLLRYSSELLIFCSLLHSISPHSYKFFRDSNQLTLPHPSTIERLCSSFHLDPKIEQSEENFLLYARNKFQYLKPNEILTSLMIDEIHLKPYFDYKGGNVAGKSANNEKAANAAYVFMLHSFLSDFSDVVHVLPVNNINADFLHEFVKKVILGLEEIGYRVISVSSDNNSLNGKAMSLFSIPNKLSIVYPHPADPKRPLFFIFDPVHIFKCIRNNWINQKNGQNMYFPDFDDYSKTKTACFQTIKNIHSLEEGQLLKYAYGISVKALCPTSMERQNVRLVAQIFNDHVVEGLRKVGNQTNEPHCSDTADFIEIILKWWKIMNVKSLFKGTHKRDKFMEPLTSNLNDEKRIFLHKFLNWLDAWKAAKYDSGFLTRETYTALSHTTHAVLELCDYCTNELGFTYLLPGKIQTDLLERRFGKFRQLSGGQYNVTIRQIFENESKLRLQSLRSLQVKSAQFGEISINLSENCETDIKCESSEYLKFIEINVEDDDLISLIPILPIINYVAGYCCYSYAKSKKCHLCKDSITVNDTAGKLQILDDVENSYIQALDRGGLAYPKPEVLEIILHSYVVVQKLISAKYEHLFLQMQKQKALTVKLILHILQRKEIYLNENKCSIHSSNFIIESLVSRSVNTFLNNYCRECNNYLTNDRLFKNKATAKVNQVSNTKVKKRKIQTLTN